MAELEEWITNLAGAAVITPDPAAPTVQRMSAEQIRDTLFKQLGLSNADFFDGSDGIGSHGIPEHLSRGEGNYPVQGTDELPGSYAGDPAPYQRHAALGGAQTLAGRRADLSPSSPFAVALTNMSQRWCKAGIAKESSSTLLFPHVAPTAPSVEAESEIKENMAYLSVHFLGQPSTPEEINDVFETVFLPLEAETDPQTAWAGVCAYFIRHPLWVTN
jgi:hypothetical protein